jgi:amidase
MAVQSWEIEVKKAQDILEKSIPKQWMAPPDKLLSADVLNVEHFPTSSGLLSAEEIRVTEMSATALVESMGQGRITAESVVTSFLKRAVLGHQLVRTIYFI